MRAPQARSNPLHQSSESLFSRKRRRGGIENRIQEGKNTLRWHKASCHRFAANQARLLMEVLA
ncbi:MAG: transposase [Thermodesulfobacteriota bacterium]